MFIPTTSGDIESTTNVLFVATEYVTSAPCRDSSPTRYSTSPVVAGVWISNRAVPFENVDVFAISWSLRYKWTFASSERGARLESVPGNPSSTITEISASDFRYDSDIGMATLRSFKILHVRIIMSFSIPSRKPIPTN